MKGFVIKWAMKWYDEQPRFAIYQVPADCISDFCIIHQEFKDKIEDCPFSFVECQIIAHNKKQAIAKFVKKYKVPIKNNISFNREF